MKCFALILLSSLSAHATEISFSQALHDMVDKNVDMLVQQTQLRSSESSVSAAKGGFSPSLNLTAVTQSGGGAQAVYLGNASQQILSANATWNLFHSGADVAALQAAFANRENQRATLDNTYILAEGKAAQSLLHLVETQLAVNAYRQSEMNSQHFLEIAQARFDKSLLSREEMDKVAVDSSNAAAHRADAELRFFAAEQQVESQLGHANVEIRWPWEVELSPSNMRELLDEKNLEQASSRPDVIAAKAQLESEEMRSKQLWRSIFPKLDLTFSLLELQVAGAQNQDGWQSVGTLTIPIWSGLSDYSAYRIQVEARNASEQRLRQLERDIQSLARLAQNNYRLAYDQYLSRKKNLERSQHILQQDEARFKLGRSDANELNLDLTRVTEAQILALEGIEQVHTSYVALYHAFGKRIP